MVLFCLIKGLLPLTGQDSLIPIYSDHTYRPVALNLFSCLTETKWKTPPEINSLFSVTVPEQ